MIKIPAPTFRDFGCMLTSSAFTALVIMIAVKYPFNGIWLSVLCGLAAGIVLLVFSWADTPTTDSVDIWHYQRSLMAASDQALPLSPQVNSDVLMYIAITMEELGETVDATLAAVSRDSASATFRNSRVHLIHHLQSTSSVLHTCSGNLRKIVPAVADLRVELTKLEARNLFDGVCDTTVTVAGLGLAAGMPMAAGYLDVQLSNLSKVNPDTGKIDKTPDGKWIKGRHYQPPNLGRVLDQRTTADYKLRSLSWVR